MSIDTGTIQDKAQIQRIARIAGITGPKQARRDPASWAQEDAAIYCRISKASDEEPTARQRFRPQRSSCLIESYVKRGCHALMRRWTASPPATCLRCCAARPT